MSEQATAETIAQAFVAARRAKQGFADYPGAMPATLAEAYAIQAEAIALFGAPIAGWKVGRVPDGLVERYGANRLAGPIFAGSVVWADAEEQPEMPVFRNGFGAAEAEYLARLGPLPASFDRAWTNADVLPYIAELRVGIEIASSPFAGINEHGPAVTVSDFGNNNGLLIGYGISSEEDFLSWPVSLSIDGEVAGTGTAGECSTGRSGRYASCSNWRPGRVCRCRKGSGFQPAPSPASTRSGRGRRWRHGSGRAGAWNAGSESPDSGYDRMGLER